MQLSRKHEQSFPVDFETVVIPLNYLVDSIIMKWISTRCVGLRICASCRDRNVEQSGPRTTPEQLHGHDGTVEASWTQLPFCCSRSSRYRHQTTLGSGLDCNANRSGYVMMFQVDSSGDPVEKHGTRAQANWWTFVSVPRDRENATASKLRAGEEGSE